jgi:hypothetical protein
VDVGVLLAFSLPVIVLITVQSFISRSHASWTAAASPAASILVTAWLLERERKVLFEATVAINALATTAMLVGTTGVFPTGSDQSWMIGASSPGRNTHRSASRDAVTT